MDEVLQAILEAMFGAIVQVIFKGIGQIVVWMYVSLAALLSPFFAIAVLAALFCGGIGATVATMLF